MVLLYVKGKNFWHSWTFAVNLHENRVSLQILHLRAPLNIEYASERNLIKTGKSQKNESCILVKPQAKRLHTTLG